MENQSGHQLDQRCRVHVDRVHVKELEGVPYPALKNQPLVSQQIAQFDLYILRYVVPLPLQVKCPDMGMEACPVLLAKVYLHFRDLLVEETVYRVHSHLFNVFLCHLERLLEGGAPGIGP